MGPRTRPPFTVRAPGAAPAGVTDPSCVLPCSSGRGSLGRVVISAGEEAERNTQDSRPKPCLGFEYTHQGAVREVRRTTS